MPTKRLELIFVNAAGNRVTISLADPKTDLTDAVVLAAMNTIVASNVFTSPGGDLVGVYAARIVTRDITDFTVV